MGLRSKSIYDQYLVLLSLLHEPQELRKVNAIMRRVYSGAHCYPSVLRRNLSTSLSCCELQQEIEHDDEFLGILRGLKEEGPETA